MYNKFRSVLFCKLNRINRKCDRIISELIVLRHSVLSDRCRADMDETLDSLHKSALRMREMCMQERKAIEKWCNEA